MKLSHRLINSVCVLFLEGKFKEGQVQIVKTYLHSRLEFDAMPCLLINLKNVSEIDSSGMGLVVSVFKSFQQRQATLALCHLSPKNQTIFKLTQLDKFIQVYPTEEEALHALQDNSN